MKKSFTLVRVALLTLALCFAFVITALAQTISVPDHDLKLTLPEDFTEINADNAKDNIDIIKSFGYEEKSFKNYLETEGILIFATAPNDIQLNVKSWETDFSKKTEDLSFISDEALLEVRDKLIGKNYTSTSTATVNGMKLISVNKNDKDSGGEYCTVQYFTVRNGRIYSFALSFPGSLDDAKTDLAWNLICTAEIEDNISPSALSIESIILIIFIWLLIAVGIVSVIIILASFIKDGIRKRNSKGYGADYIERRK